MSVLVETFGNQHMDKVYPGSPVDQTKNSL